MAEVGYASLGIIPSFDGFQAGLERGVGGPLASAGARGGRTFGDAAGKTAGQRFGSAFKSAAKVGLVGIGALGAGAFALGRDAVSLASDLEESTNKVNQVFGKGADAVFRFSERAADALGQTNQEARDAASTFGLFGNIAGLSDKKSAKFATRMTRLASDLASFHNTEPSQAVEALGAALRGEAEPIRSFGVLLDEATLKAEAMRLGLLKPVKDQAKIKSYQVAVIDGQKKYNDAVEEFGSKSLEALKAEASLGTARDRLKKATEGTIPPLTQQQKVLAAQSSIFRQTEVAQGDFARTSDGLANQQRRLAARFDDAKAKLGVGLLPIMTDAAGFLLDEGIPAFERFSDWFNQKGLPAIQGFADDMRPLAKSLLPAAGDALGIVRDAVKEAAPFAKDMVDAFNNMPDWAKKAIVGGGLGLLAGKKLGLFGGKDSGGALGAGAKLFSKPVKVFETNPLALGKGGGPAVPPGKTPAGAKPPSGNAKGLLSWLTAIPLPALGALGADTLPPMLSEEEGKRWLELNGYVNGVRTDVSRLDNEITQLGPYRVGLEMPALNPIFSKVQQFGSILDGLDGRQIQIYINARANGPAGDLGAPNRSGTDSGEPSTRGATVNDNRVIIHGDVRPHSFAEFERDARRRRRARSGGGRG